MSTTLRRPRRAAPIGALLALALAASACGSEASTALDVAESASTEPAPTTTGAESTTTAASAAATEAPAEEPRENLFPPVDVVRISDGTTLNLATELGGGDLPVLLWFWAPH
ncbi:MAG: hypothetical protein AAFN30_18935 [Actinomycetota bacterium]